jgi:hypothetical protein
VSEKRISRRQLEEAGRLLADRDMEILRSLQKCRYMTTHHIRRLHFTGHATANAALRAANRGLIKLQAYGLIAALKRRIGGVRAGSGAYVWVLSETGNRLLCMNDKTDKPRKRFFEPSPAFMNHTLEITETFVRIKEICSRYHLKQGKTELEPACWRNYTDRSGKSVALKPDLFAIVLHGKYEYSYFLEADLDTEAPSVVLEKCKRYVQYYRSGAEQKQSGIFPLTVWIVPDISRQECLQRHIAACKELTPKALFVVITRDEFETLLALGAEAINEMKGVQYDE